MTASLPMYDWPETRAATDTLWRELARRLAAEPVLDRRAAHAEVWSEPDMLFSQTCGYPLTHAFRHRLTLLATPQYRAAGCEGPLYCSIILAREAGAPATFRGRIAAYNNADSMSGMLALKLTFAPLAQAGRFFSRAVATGGHLASLQAVRDGRADVCAIDAVCVALVRRYRPDNLEGLVEVARSPLVPGLPFVTSQPQRRAEVLTALSEVFADPALAATRAALLLDGLSVLPLSAYDRILQLESQMEQQGGLHLQGTGLAQ